MRAALSLCLIGLLCGCAPEKDPFARHAAQAAEAVREVVPEERAARETFGAEVRVLLMDRRYDDIDSLVAGLRRSGERFGDGYLKLLAVYAEGLRRPADEHAESEWNALLGALEAYHAARPASTVAPIALAQALTSQAWRARGTGWAHTVDEHSRRRFAEGLEQARATLAGTDPSVRATLDACLAANRIALGQGWNPDVCEELFRMGTSIDPGCEVLYEQRAAHLLPRWYGAPGEWERFMDGAMRRLPKAESERVYAEVMAALSKQHTNLFDETGARWHRVKEGYRGILARHPKSLRRKSEFCRLAVLADDWEVAGEMFHAMGPRADLEVWQSRESFARAHLWVQARKAQSYYDRAREKATSH